MTDREEKLNNLKTEIRSVLLPQQHGATLKNFEKEYKLIIGRGVPFREFGYSNIIKFLDSIHDVVSILWSPSAGDHILKAIADESTKHIERLVSKQKISKTKGIPRRQNSGVAPRFKYSTNYNTPYLPVNVKNDIIHVTKKYAHGLSISNFLTAYQREFGKVLSWSNYGYNTLKECLNTISELVVKDQNNETRVFSTHSVICQEGLKKIQVEGLSTRNNDTEGKITSSRYTTPVPVNMKKEIGSKNVNVPVAPVLPKANSTVRSSTVDNAMKIQFQSILKQYPEGIFASKFHLIYEKLSGRKLNLNELGYLNLIEMLDSMPDVFIAERPLDRYDDWVLFDARSHGRQVHPNRSNENGFDNRQPTAESVPDVIKNIRYLLKSQPDGIDMDEFLNSYEVMHNKSLNLQDLGFDSLQKFLEMIDSTVPLILENNRKILGKIMIYYVYQNDPVPNPNVLKSYVSSNIPSDAVLSSEKFHYQTLPSNIDINQYVGLFVINVETPEMMHIQFYREDTSIALECLMDKLEDFYFGESSLQYEMPESYIVRGAVCAAIWPDDGHWHRTHIISMPNPDTVFVEFVDYGTRQKIPKTNLRFLKKEFMTLPAQAVKARLNLIMPINGNSWSPAVQKRILELTKGKPLMALIDVKAFNGFLSLNLCDTTGADDIHINDVLVREGYAQYCIVRDGMQIPISSLNGLQSPEPNHFANNGQADSDCKSHLMNGYQRNDSGVNMSNKAISIDGCSSEVNALNVEQLITSSVDPSIMQRFLYQTSSPYDNDDSSIHQLNSGTNYSVPENRKGIESVSRSDVNLNQEDSIISDSSSEIFQDEEEVYENFCIEVNLPFERHVKRIYFSDGFPEVHLVVIDDNPFISSGDVAFLLWNSVDPDCVERRLTMKDISMPMSTLHEIGNEQLFIQLKRQRVRGIKADDIYNPSITFFQFKNVIDILNIFGHPSVAVRGEIENEMERFNPNDSFWKITTEKEMADGQDVRDTDSDKQQRVCLYDLKSSLQALKFKKQKLKNESLGQNNPDTSIEIRKIELRCADIENQINMLQQKVVSYSVNKQYRD